MTKQQLVAIRRFLDDNHVRGEYGPGTGQPQQKFYADARQALAELEEEHRAAELADVQPPKQ